MRELEPGPCNRGSLPSKAAAQTACCSDNIKCGVHAINAWHADPHCLNRHTNPSRCTRSRYDKESLLNSAALYMHAYSAQSICSNTDNSRRSDRIHSLHSLHLASFKHPGCTSISFHLYRDQCRSWQAAAALHRPSGLLSSDCLAMAGSRAAAPGK